MNRTVLALYLLMLFCHVAHVFEEIWGNFFMVGKLGLGGFLMANLALFAIPLVVLYLVWWGKGWAYVLAMIYALVMIVNGLGHNILTLITGRYFGGFAGGFTGIALVAVGAPLVYHLRRAMPAPQESQHAEAV